MRWGTLLVIFVTFAGCGERSTTCLNGLTDCDGECVNLKSDWRNCGACGHECKVGDTPICQGGMCQDGPCGPLQECSGACADLNSDNDHCGECDNKCDTTKGFVCMAGTCTCTPGLEDCNGKCVDTRTDDQNCGGCGIDCPVFDCDGKRIPCTVLKGVCPSNCPGGMCRCGLTCVDPDSDPLNCGSCGNACASSQTCVNGQCT